METPNYMYVYWKRVEQDALKQLEVARRELARLALKEKE